MQGRQAGVTGHSRKQRGKSDWTKVRGVWAQKPLSFCSVSCFVLFFFLCSEPFVSAHINALPGLIISHACHVCHLHSRTAKNERSRTILSRTKKRPLNFNNFLGWIPAVLCYVSLSYFCIVSSALAQTGFCFTQILTAGLLLWWKPAENVHMCSARESCSCGEDRGAWKQQKHFSMKNKKYNLGFK